MGFLSTYPTKNSNKQLLNIRCAIDGSWVSSIDRNPLLFASFVNFNYKLEGLVRSIARAVAGLQ